MVTKPTVEFQRLLQDAFERGASDLHLLAGEPPICRISGELVRGQQDPLTGDDIRQIVYAAVGKVRAEAIASETGHVIVHCGLENIFDGHLCVTRAMGEFTVTVRLFPAALPSPADARIPQGLLKACESSHGLVLVSGQTGSGKTTSALTLLEHINAHQTVHICTVEDPLSVRLEPKQAVVRQQAVGIDTPNFLSALRAILAQDPDVIFVNEIRDLPTLEACVTAAQIGHLVISVLHAGSPKAAIERMIDVQPEDMKAAFRRSLAGVLRAVSAQQLLPRASGKGMVAAYGLLVVDDQMRNAIAEGKDVLERTGPLPEGSQSLADDIQTLLKSGIVSEQAAREALYRVS